MVKLLDTYHVYLYIMYYFNLNTYVIICLRNYDVEMLRKLNEEFLIIILYRLFKKFENGHQIN